VLTQAEFGEQVIRNQARGSIEGALFPRGLDLASIRAEPIDVGDVQVMLGRAVEHDSTARRENCGLIVRVDACHQQRRDLDLGGIPAS
jgi:hypothetical protein